MPDYSFFRTHTHKLYREFLGFPRYSVISRKFTDEFSKKNDSSCSLDTLFICDGATAQNTAQFFFPVAKKLGLSVIGTNLDFTELPKLRFRNHLEEEPFESFKQYSLLTDKNSHPTTNKGHDIDACTSFIPFPSNLSLKRGNDYPPDLKIASGVVKDLNDFYPKKFNISRLNIGDFIEYRQIFTPNWPDIDENPEEIKSVILQEVEKVLAAFDVDILFLSLYKLARFYKLGAKLNKPIVELTYEMKLSWNYSESLLVHNPTRRIWEEEPIHALPQFFNSPGYLILFNPY
ncbi:MAG: hypothetical protein ACW98F_02980 [Candidatus Hodarchaeales archaeon]|jgi:hypothetical protein